MLMIVPLMIWSARTEMDSQAWTAEKRRPVRRAASTPMTIAGVAPKRNDGSARTAWPTSDATYQPVKALASIMPSMPMFTTPERSFIIPHIAPRAIGVASARMIVEFEVTTSTLYATSWKISPRTGMSNGNSIGQGGVVCPP